MIQACPRKCTDCRDIPHHWMEESYDPDDPDKENDPLRPAIIWDWVKWCRDNPAQAPCAPIVWRCKHCDFWMRSLGECQICEGPVDEVGCCVGMCGEREEAADNSDCDIPIWVCLCGYPPIEGNGNCPSCGAEPPWGSPYDHDEGELEDGYYEGDQYFSPEDAP